MITSPGFFGDKEKEDHLEKVHNMNITNKVNEVKKLLDECTKSYEEKLQKEKEEIKNTCSLDDLVPTFEEMALQEKIANYKWYNFLQPLFK